MGSWSRTLDRAGIHDPGLRRDYSKQRRLVARYARAEYLAVRLLMPTHLAPHVIAAVAFMHVTDDRIDQGTAEQRLFHLAEWDRLVRHALEHPQESPQPVLRVIAHSASRMPPLRSHITAFLDGSPAEVHCEGFETESDFQQYIDAYCLPALMLTTGLLPREASAEDTYLAGCRSLIEAMQRLDSLQDLAEDAREGRLGIPQDALKRHGVQAENLAARLGDASAVSGLAREQTALVRSAMEKAHVISDTVAAEARPFTRALIAVQELRLQAVETHHASLLQGPPKLPLVSALRILLREFWSARIGRMRRPARPGR